MVASHMALRGNVNSPRGGATTNNNGKDKGMEWNKIYQAFYEAALKAIELTGDSYKQLSWFGYNKLPQPPAKGDEG